ncbi:hypothetical protein pdam_00004267 [Pocillopora damicornis]|uniref:Uncharacterized protein n=1 Tax=Pocillopora damicornis TaxID=46731 RepID=A0A3M6UGC1_POCDA|nr:hypothetical protein pdam_00004267 [Pocillopora damicornis]
MRFDHDGFINLNTPDDLASSAVFYYSSHSCVFLQNNRKLSSMERHEVGISKSCTGKALITSICQMGIKDGSATTSRRTLIQNFFRCPLMIFGKSLFAKT